MGQPDRVPADSLAMPARILVSLAVMNRCVSISDRFRPDIAAAMKRCVASCLVAIGAAVVSCECVSRVYGQPPGFGEPLLSEPFLSEPMRAETWRTQTQQEAQRGTPFADVGRWSELDGPQGPSEMIVSDDFALSDPTMTLAMAMELPVERFRRSFFQGGELSGGYVLGLGDQAGGLNQTYQEARVAVAVPLGSLENILAVSPFFRTDWIDGPTDIDVPAALYSTGVALFQRKKWTERCSTTVLLTPSVRSDFTTSENAFRLFGLGLVSWQASSQWSIDLGAVYFDRADLGVLPVVGATWTPRPWWKLELTMPRPRLNYRVWKDGALGEAWAYVGGQLGGNTWAVSRRDGSHDELTIGELRLLFGYEVLRQGNRGGLVEFGYAFNRSVEYENQGIELDLDDGIFFQAGWKF